MTSCIQGLSNSGEAGREGRGDLNGGLETSGRRQKKASLEIKVPGSSRGAALSPMAAIHSPSYAPKSSLPAAPLGLPETGVPPPALNSKLSGVLGPLP